jgi:type IV pilus assembly protein PilZ
VNRPSGTQRPDARRFRRLTARVTVEIRRGDRTFTETATTLGAGGLFVETRHPLPERTVLNLRFQLPGSERVFEIEGRVVWSTPAGNTSDDESRGMGIEFTDRLAVSALAREIESAGPAG